ncbi:MAG: hypothetical protein KKD94_01005 [Nanoarchaeota archaeon]|nr:hypothetical protein [Nanoarchaeota archaeon]
MRKKVLTGIVIMVSLILFLSLGLGQEEYSVEISKAFDCLDERVDSTTLSLEEAVFSSLARVQVEKANETIEQKKSSTEFCWPNTGCKVKETSQVALAKLSMGENIGNITEWLVLQSGVTQELTWYLQIIIDNNGPASCVVNYAEGDHSINIDEEMKLSGSPGSCLTVTSSGYWLKIKDSCLGKEFNVQCDESFKTNLLYEKNSGWPTYVSSQTHGASAGSWTLEEITAKCFKKGTACDYEGSLWAAVALYANSEEISEFAPYLRALASDNERYFPSAFLMAILEGGEEHYSKIIESQRARPEGAYWEMSNTPYNKYYDTSLAMLALGGADSPEIGNANTVDYLFEHQDESGCWHGDNVRDTAFVIYSSQLARPERPPECSSTYLSLCLTEEDCVDEGGYWYGGVCNAIPEPVCGDGEITGGEACDGVDLNDKNCTLIGYGGGELGCVDAGEENECTFDVSVCEGDGPEVVCPDGQINGSEVCDGTNLDGENCTSKGYIGGVLACSSNCLTFDVSGCDPGQPPVPPPGTGNGTTNGTGGGGTNLITDCELAQYYCAPSMSVCLEAEGSFFPQETHGCASPYEFCCTVEVPEQNCASLGGNVCAYDEICSGGITESSDGACCIGGLCEAIGVTGCTYDGDCPTGKICLGGGCVTSSGPGGGCVSDNDCSSGEECKDGSCVEKGSNLWVWIMIILILIVLVVLGIVYRDKLRLWLFKLGKGKKKGIPGMPPAAGPFGRRPTPRFGPAGRRPGMPMRRPIVRGAVKVRGKYPGDKEMEETFNKLKEMGK